MNWLKKLTGTQAPTKTQVVSGRTGGSASTMPGSPSEGAGQVLATLKAFLSERMDESARVAAADIPDGAHVLDGGYVDSVTAADFLAFIKTRYGVRLAETDLAGGLGRLATLAEHLTGRSA
jgi:acyl carrier protein